MTRFLNPILKFNSIIKNRVRKCTKTAMERSGSRGADARKILNRNEEELNEMERLTLD